MPFSFHHTRDFFSLSLMKIHRSKFNTIPFVDFVFPVHVFKCRTSRLALRLKTEPTATKFQLPHCNGPPIVYSCIPIFLMDLEGKSYTYEVRFFLRIMLFHSQKIPLELKILFFSKKTKLSLNISVVSMRTFLLLCR